MDLDAIRNEARLRFGVSVTDQLYTDVNLATLINAAIRRVNADQDWPWMEISTTAVTVADTQAITLASNARRLIKMSFEQHEVRYVNHRTVADYFGATGAPRFYTFQGGSWLLLPTPDRVYTIDYTYVRDLDIQLVLGTDVPLIPDWALDAAISYTCVFMARRGRDAGLEANYYGEYARTMDVLRDDVSKSIEGMTPRRTRVEDRAPISFVVP